MGSTDGKELELGSAHMIVLPLLAALALVPLLLPEGSSKLYTDTITVVASATGLAFSFFITRIREARNFRSIGTAFSLSLSLFLIAEVTWAYYELILGEKAPKVGYADIFWIAGYLPLIYLCADTVWKHHEHIGTRELLAVFVGWFLFFNMVILPVTFYNIGDGENLLELVVLMVYPFMDAVLILLLATILIMYRKACLLIYWQFFAMGVVLFVLGDLSYSISAVSDTYTTGSLPDVFFILFYLVIALGLGVMILRRDVFRRIGPASRYRINHVFLNYKNGCIISHAFSLKARQFTDDDVLMGMLVAIQDFARESFADKSPDQLEQLKYGDMSFILHRRGKVMLVAGIDGEISSDLHDRFDSVLDSIEERYGRILKDWDGTTAPLRGTKKMIATLLTEEESTMVEPAPDTYEKVTLEDNRLSRRKDGAPAEEE